MGKKEKLLSIGEISKSLGITRRIIINYEDKGLIKPDVKDGDSGNRYYTVDSFTRIRTIRILQNMGLMLDEIRGYYDDKTDLTPMLSRLEKLRDELNLNIEKIRERINVSNESEIHHVTIPAQTVYTQTSHCITVEEKKDILRNISITSIRKYGSDMSKRLYYAEFNIKTPEVVSYCVTVPSKSEGEFVYSLPKTEAICIYHHGSYETLPDVREKLLSYAKENNIKVEGICRHIYLEGPPQHKDPQKFITQVALIIKNNENGE